MWFLISCYRFNKSSGSTTRPWNDLHSVHMVTIVRYLLHLCDMWPHSSIQSHALTHHHVVHCVSHAGNPCSEWHLLYTHRKCGTCAVHVVNIAHVNSGCDTRHMWSTWMWIRENVPPCNFIPSHYQAFHFHLNCYCCNVNFCTCVQIMFI